MLITEVRGYCTHQAPKSLSGTEWCRMSNAKEHVAELRAQFEINERFDEIAGASTELQKHLKELAEREGTYLSRLAAEEAVLDAEEKARSNRRLDDAAAKSRDDEIQKERNRIAL